MKKKENLYLSSKKHVGAFNQPLIFFLFTCLIFFVTGARLFWIQIINSSYYKKLSEENRIKLISNPPIRGRLLDRNGVILADNKLFYSLSLQKYLHEHSFQIIGLGNFCLNLIFYRSKILLR